MVTWRELLAEASGDDVVTHVKPGDEVLDVRFDDGYGVTGGPEFLAWSHRFVYFPVTYDGAEWVGRAPRHPDDPAGALGPEHGGGW
jgi:hypothetical protein